MAGLANNLQPYRQPLVREPAGQADHWASCHRQGESDRKPVDIGFARLAVNFSDKEFFNIKWRNRGRWTDQKITALEKTLHLQDDGFANFLGRDNLLIADLMTGLGILDDIGQYGVAVLGKQIIKHGGNQNPAQGMKAL